MRSIKPNEIKRAILDQDFDVLRIEKKFDVEKFRQITLQSLTEHQPKSKDGYSDYKALGLQYTDESDPYYDSINQVSFVSPSGKVSPHRKRSAFFHKNSVGEKYEEFYSYFSPECVLTRGRILIASPDFKLEAHSDGAFCATLHFPIQTTSDCLIHVEDRAYTLPADGHFYLLNVAKSHYVTNHSEIDRIHITYPLSPLNFYRWKRSELNTMDLFFKMFEITDISVYRHLQVDEEA